MSVWMPMNQIFWVGKWLEISKHPAIHWKKLVEVGLLLGSLKKRWHISRVRFVAKKHFQKWTATKWYNPLDLNIGLQVWFTAKPNRSNPHFSTAGKSLLPQKFRGWKPLGVIGHTLPRCWALPGHTTNSRGCGHFDAFCGLDWRIGGWPKRSEDGNWEIAKGCVSFFGWAFFRDSTTGPPSKTHEDIPQTPFWVFIKPYKDLLIM